MKYRLPFFLILLSFFLAPQLEAQELSFHQGFWKMKYYEDTDEISKQDFIMKINSVPEGTVQWKKYKSNLAIATVSSLVGGVGFAYWINADDGDNTAAWQIMGFGGLVIASIFNANSNKNRRDAIFAYNSQFDTSRIRVTPASSGIGLALHF